MVEMAISGAVVSGEREINGKDGGCLSLGN